MIHNKRETDMASRWMQQKKFKQKRMRKAWAKSYSRKNTGPMKDFITITQTKDEKGEPYRSVTDLSIKGRSKSAANYLSEYLLKRFKFNPNSSEALYVRTAGLHSDLAPGSKELVLARLNQSRRNAGSVQGEEEFVQHVCTDRPTSKRTLFLGRDICFFIEVRTTRKGVVILKSCDYTDRGDALKANRGENDPDSSDRILWIDVHYPDS